MKRRIIIQIVIAFCTTFSACKKDVLETSEVSNTGPYSSLQDFYNQNGAAIQTFTITTPELTNTITGQLGTQIRIIGNSLRDSTGALPAGSVTMKLREVYDVKDMLLSHLPTTANGSMLQSGGMVYLEFTAGAVEYHPVNTMQVWMPTDTQAVAGMDVFVGTPDENTGVNWQVDTNGLSFVFFDSVATSYKLYVYSLGYNWVNCDHFYSVGIPANVTITPSVSAERNETVDLAVYLLFPSINSVVNVVNTSSTQSVTANNIPVGMQSVAAIIGVGRITGKAYFGKTNFTVTSPQNVSVQVTQKTNQEIFDSLSNL